MREREHEVLLIGPPKPVITRGLANFTVHSLAAAPNRDEFLASVGNVRAMAVSAPVEHIGDALFARLPSLEIISSFGVGYDHIDAVAADKRGIILTHAPDVLNEEVADTAIGCCFARCANFRRPNVTCEAGASAAIR